MSSPPNIRISTQAVSASDSFFFFNRDTHPRGLLLAFSGSSQQSALSCPIWSHNSHFTPENFVSKMSLVVNSPSRSNDDTQKCTPRRRWGDHFAENGTAPPQDFPTRGQTWGASTCSLVEKSCGGAMPFSAK